jgi:hypothetical protein
LAFGVVHQILLAVRADVYFIPVLLFQVCFGHPITQSTRQLQEMNAKEPGGVA